MTVALAGVSLPIYFTGLLSLSIFSYGPAWLEMVPERSLRPVYPRAAVLGRAT